MTLYPEVAALFLIFALGAIVSSIALAGVIMARDETTQVKQNGEKLNNAVELAFFRADNIEKERMRAGARNA